MRNAIFCSIAVALALTTSALAQAPSDKGGAVEKPKAVEKDKATEKQADPAPKAPAGSAKPAKVVEPVTCTLLTKEAPRGGRLEVEGAKLGKSPVVKIGGAVTRIIERPGDKIAVQIPSKSDGGAVVVRVNGDDIACGTLTIIGLD